MLAVEVWSCCTLDKEQPGQVSPASRGSPGFFAGERTLSCSFCSAGMPTAHLCPVLALGVPSCTLRLGERGRRRVLGLMLVLQPAMGAEQGFYTSLLRLSQI